jgi:dihydrofolate reductase
MTTHESQAEQRSAGWRACTSMLAPGGAYGCQRAPAAQGQRPIERNAPWAIDVRAARYPGDHDRGMGTVFMHAVVSVDGFIADESDDVGPLFDWYFNGEAEIVDGGPFRVSAASLGYVRPMWERIGATVMGRHLFDLTNGWEGRPPAGDHIVVVSHRPKPDGWHPEASAQFVADVGEAIAVAKRLAAGRDVAVTAGDVGGQALALGLIDEVAMDVVPVVFGTGKRYFGGVTDRHLLDDPHAVIKGNRVLHLLYRPRR